MEAKVTMGAQKGKLKGWATWRILEVPRPCLMGGARAISFIEKLFGSNGVFAANDFLDTV